MDGELLPMKYLGQQLLSEGNQIPWAMEYIAPMLHVVILGLQLR